MSDALDPTTPNADRLVGVVGRLQQTILMLPRFRPADVTAAAEFDKLQADLLQTMVNVTQAAAVDQASIAVAVSLIEKNIQAAKESQQNRGDLMVRMAERAVTFPIKGAG